MLIVLAATCLQWSGASLARPLPGHRLPEGAEQSVRELEVDIRRLSADLTIDMRRQNVAGSVTVAFRPLRHDLPSVTFDAADPVVSKVELLSGNATRDLEFRHAERKLQINLPPGVEAGEDLELRIHYTAEPGSGLYFFPKSKAVPAEAWNYGEGGRHYGWLPLYNDTNDRFAVDFRITVAKPYTVLGNGKLLETRTNANGTRTFHWLQEAPIPNYLLALNIGEFVGVPLENASLGTREVPLTVWTHAGDEQSAAYSFGATPDMIEYFSERFGYEFAWDKYDQMTLRNFSGAMETTSMVGFTPLTLTYEGGPVDNGPQYDEAFPTWTNDDTIAHELAHHWFGDLVTCRSLASLFLNESFATFSHTVWNQHANGEDDLTYQRWRYLHRYLDFVHDSGTVRPLEYYRYDASNDMYTEEITYLKGALVLHMLRHMLGDEDFYRAISIYLRRHEFGEVESIDFQRALEDVTGRQLDGFFEDWIRDGGGYPALEASWQFAPGRKAVDLSIEQLQAELPYENLFELPVDVEVVTETGSTRHTVDLEERTLSVALPVDGEPLMVIVDPGNWLVADLHQDETPAQLIYKLEQGDVAVALRAARQLAEDYPRRSEVVQALTAVLAGDGFWGLRQEVALDLGTMGGEAAQAALLAALDDPDRRIRRAGAVGLGRLATEGSADALATLIDRDEAEDVVAAAAIALGKMQAPGGVAVLTNLLKRESRYHDLYLYSGLAALAEYEDPALAKDFATYIGPEYAHDVRLVALDGWARAAPNDPKLAAALKSLAGDADYAMQGRALDTLGGLHRIEDLPFLRKFARSASDPNLRKAAHDAAETISGFDTRN